MKTISVRDLSQRWPEVEASLEIEKEIVITRDAKPVAKLVRIAEGEGGAGGRVSHGEHIATSSGRSNAVG